MGVGGKGWGRCPGDVGADPVVAWRLAGRHGAHDADEVVYGRVGGVSRCGRVVGGR